MSVHQRMLLGSVSRYCIEHAPCNVVVVRHEINFEQEEINTPVTPAEVLAAELVVKRMEFN